MRTEATPVDGLAPLELRASTRHRLVAPGLERGSTFMRTEATPVDGLAPFVLRASTRHRLVAPALDRGIGRKHVHAN